LQRSRYADIEASKLVLGTAQLGMTYGIANRAGKPSYDAVVEMLDRAFQLGITSIDTAALYGDSEAVLGRALRALGLTHRFFLTTKIVWMDGIEGVSAAEVARRVRESVLRSLENLGLPSLQFCLLHRAIDLPCFDALLKLKEEGLVHHAGVSVYTADEAFEAMGRAGVEAVQVPTSVLDQRCLRAGVFDIAASRGVTVFVRSIYLQGLLMLAEPEIPTGLEAVKPTLAIIREIASRSGIPLVELILRFGLSIEGATGILVGVETVRQVEDNARIAEQGPLPADVYQEIKTRVPDLPEQIVNPGMWPRRS